MVHIIKTGRENGRGEEKSEPHIWVSPTSWKIDGLNPDQQVLIAHRVTPLPSGNPVYWRTTTLQTLNVGLKWDLARSGSLAEIIWIRANLCKLQKWASELHLGLDLKSCVQNAGGGSETGLLGPTGGRQHVLRTTGSNSNISWGWNPNPDFGSVRNHGNCQVKLRSWSKGSRGLKVVCF